MKTFKIFVALTAIIFGTTMLFTSCEGASGTAPNNMNGKAMQIHGYTIEFKSNTSANISQGVIDGWNDWVTFESIEYKKTSATSATITIKGIDYGEYPGEYYTFYNCKEIYNFSLIFASPNQGIYSGNYEIKGHPMTPEYHEEIIDKGSFGSDGSYTFTVF